MAFWSSSTLEPLRKFRFTIQLGDESNLWYAKNVTQPSVDISVSEYQLLNHKIKYPGIATWNDIDINIVDVGGKGKSYYDKLKKIGYKFNGSNDGIEKQHYAAKPVLITKIDSKGAPIEIWTLFNAFIKSIKYGDLDYSSDELLDITLTISYDSAVLDKKQRGQGEELPPPVPTGNVTTVEEEQEFEERE